LFVKVFVRRFLISHRLWLESCGVYPLTVQLGLRVQVSYQRPRRVAKKPHVVVFNRLNREFSRAVSDEAWVRNITPIHTQEGNLLTQAIIAVKHISKQL